MYAIPYIIREHVYIMNDIEGKSFAQIADWIEENL